MFRWGTLLCVCFVLFGDLVRPQLEGGLLGILKPEGVQVSVPGLLGLTDSRKTTTTTTTTTTPPPPPPTEATKATRKPNRQTTAPCIYTPTSVNGKKSCQGKLVFQENFAKIADKKWVFETKFAGDPDYEFVIYQNNDENIYTRRNTLHIRPTLTEHRYGAGYVTDSEGLNLGDDCTGVASTADCFQKPRAWQILPPVLSSQISTKGHFSFLYGVVEIRAKLPKGDWIYPELYLRPKSSFYGPGHASGTIKIAFLPGNAESGKQLSGGCVFGISDNARTYGVRNISSSANWNDGFHVFQVEWKPDRITVRVDDDVYGNILPPDGGFATEQQHLGIDEETADAWKKGTLLAPFDKEMYISLGVGAGGQSFIDKDFEAKPWSNDDPKAQLNFYRGQDTWSRTWTQDSELQVDYVKVWAL